MSFFRRRRQRQPDPQEFVQTIRAFIEAETWDESRRIVEQHPELLTDMADTLLGHLVELQESDVARQEAEAHRALLRRCREVGIEAAFAELVGAQYAASLPDDIPEEMRPFLAALAALPEAQRDGLAEIFDQADSPEALDAALNADPELLAALERAMVGTGGLSVPPRIPGRPAR